MGTAGRQRLRALDASTVATVGTWLVIALALSARLFRADAQSLWYDEGTSAQLATRTARAIVAAAAGDIHPPLYYLLLAAWSDLFGHGVVALRALSAVLGAAQVAATIAIGRRLGGPRLGLVAGVLAATSPYLIWYGQEVRMYVLAGALGAGLVALAVGDVDALVARGDPNSAADVRPRPAAAAARTALIALLATAALYTQYLAGAAAVAVGGTVMALGWAIAWRRQGVLPRASIARWLGAYGVAGALFAPWLVRAWPAVRDWPALGAPVGLGFVGREAVGAYAFGVKGPVVGGLGWGMLAGIAVLGVGWTMLVGRRGGSRREERWAAGVAVAVAVAPPLLVWLASLRRPAWNPKFIIAGAPGFELLLAVGVVGTAQAARVVLGRRRWMRGSGGSFIGPIAGAIALVVVLWPRLVVWHANAYDAAYQRDDYRGIAAEIAARAGPDDAVMLNAPTQIEVFGYYDRGAHATFPLPIGRPVDVDATERALSALGARHRDVYGVLWATNESDPTALVETWLNTYRYKADDVWFGNVRLAAWAAAREPRSVVGLAQAVVFGDEIELLELVAAPVRDPVTADAASPAERRSFELNTNAGDYLTLDAVWHARVPSNRDFVVFVQLLDPAGRLIATRDMRPRGGTSATSTWRPGPMDAPASASAIVDPAATGGPVLDLIALRVPPGTPPGDGYRLVLGLYDPATGQRLLPDSGGDAFEVARVTVRAP